MSTDTDVLNGTEMLTELNNQVVTIPVYNSVPILKYYQTANELLRQAEMYNEDQDMERAYVMYHKFASMVLHTIAGHSSYKTVQYKSEKLEARRKCEEALNKCEVLKPKIKDKYDAEAAAAKLAAMTLAETTATASAPEEPSTSEFVLPPGYDRAKSWANLKLPPPTVTPPATSKPSSPTSEEKVAYPNAAGYSDGTSAAAVRAGAALPGQKKAAPATTKKKAAQLFTLRPVVLNEQIMDEFMRHAASNTKRNIETCGILCGQIKNNVLTVTAVIMPKQKATADTCVTESEEEMIGLQDKHNLITLGWIHTHPSQTCFLSSIDLHTHFSYQIMLPEAIAIVMAPSKIPNRGLFHVTPAGLDSLKDCTRSGFHQHANSDSLWGVVAHVTIEKGKTAPAFKFFDLR